MSSERASLPLDVHRRCISVLILLCAGCRGRQSALDPKGPVAREIYDLWVVLLVGSTAVLVVVCALAVVALRVKTQPDDRRRGLGVAAGAVTTIVLLVALLTYDMLVSRAITAQPPDAIEIRIAAHQWWWEVSYPGDVPSEQVRTANELRVPVGRPVHVTLESRDVIHSFWTPHLHGKVDAIPGQKNTLWFQADEPGVYRGQCAEFCGLQHAHMAFYVIAEPDESFERWRRQQNRAAAPPPDELAAKGREVFLSSTCPLCHTVRGTSAMAAAGPDLTHLASRVSLAAGTLRNGRGQLAGWILDPQHIKPGSFMPRTDLESEELQALLHYLESLR